MTAASEARNQVLKQDDALGSIAAVVQNQCFCHREDGIVRSSRPRVGVSISWDDGVPVQGGGETA